MSSSEKPQGVGAAFGEKFEQEQIETVKGVYADFTANFPLRAGEETVPISFRQLNELMSSITIRMFQGMAGVPMGESVTASEEDLEAALNDLIDSLVGDTKNHH